MHGSRKVSKKVYGFSLRLLRDEIASHAETTISTLFWFCVLLFNLVPRTSPLAFEMHREVPGTFGKAKIHPNIVDFGWMEKSTRWHTKLFLAMPLGSLSFCLRHHYPVPELSFLPAPCIEESKRRVQDNLHAHARNEPIKYYYAPTFNTEDTSKGDFWMHRCDNFFVFSISDDHARLCAVKSDKLNFKDKAFINRWSASQIKHITAKSTSRSRQKSCSTSIIKVLRSVRESLFVSRCGRSRWRFFCKEYLASTLSIHFWAV